MQAHILYLSPIEISSLVDNFQLKVGKFELKSYPKSWEVWLQIFIFDQSPHPIPWSPPPPPLGHNFDSCIINDLFLKLRKSTFQGKKKDLWCADEAFRIILLQRHNKFWGVI